VILLVEINASNCQLARKPDIIMRGTALPESHENLEMYPAMKTRDSLSPIFLTVSHTVFFTFNIYHTNDKQKCPSVCNRAMERMKSMPYMQERKQSAR
jgi:hypothetical protein